MTLLGGDAAELFGELLGDEYLDATLHSGTVTVADNGDRSRAETTRGCKVQVDRATERMRDADGFTESDRAVIVLTRPPAPYEPVAELTSDDAVTVNEGPYAGVKFNLASPIEGDPALAGWTCRGVRADG